MTYPVSFPFSIGDDVKIKELGLTGRVFARCDRGNNIRDYRVIWWAESKRNDAWLYEHEIEPRRES